MRSTRRGNHRSVGAIMAKMFPRVKVTHTGYHMDQEEDFFDDAREDYEDGGQMTAPQVAAAASALVRAGYAPTAVDDALARVGAAFAARDRVAVIEQHGQEEWLKEVASRATVLFPRLTRPVELRFRPPARGK